MQLPIHMVATLSLRVCRDHLFAAVLAYRVHEISLPPESAAPKHLFYLRGLREHFARDHTLHCRHYPCRTLSRHQLDEKVHVISV